MIDPKVPYILEGFTAVKEDVPDIKLSPDQSPNNQNVETDTMQGVITKKPGFKSIGKVGSVLSLDTCEATTNWTFASNITGSLDTSNPVVGSKDIQMVVGTFGTGIMAYKNFSSVDWSAYSGVGFYIKSSEATNAGYYQFIVSSASGGATPVEIVNVPALVASVWQYVYLPFANAGSTRTAVLSFALKIAVSQNTQTLNVDNFELVRADDFPIDTCEVAWTGNTNVTTTLESFAVVSNSGVTQQATSVKNVMGSAFTTGLIASRTFPAVDISLYGYIGVWVYSVQGLYGGSLTLKLSSAGGVLESIPIKDIVPAGQWTRINLGLSTPISDNAIITASLYANVNLGGYTVYLGGIRVMKPVVATNEYIRTDGSRIMMVSNGTNVYASADGGATFSVVAGGLNNSYFVWMNTFNGECFWGNGYDWNMKYTINSQVIVYASVNPLSAYYMPKARFMWSHQSSVAMLLYAGSPVTIRFSDPAILSSEALWFPAGRQYDADAETGDYLVCAKDFGERSVVFLSNSFIILSGSDQSSFQWLPRNFDIGCTVRDSVQIKDEAYMVFANEKGIYRMDESFVPALISDSIKTSYANLNQPSINNSGWEQSTEPEFESGTYGNLIDTVSIPGKILQKGQTAFDDWYLASSTTTDVIADGYTTKTIDLCEVAWTGASGVTVVVDPYIYYQGSGSVLLEVETSNTGILAYHNFSAIDLSSNTILPTPQGYVSLWVYATAGSGIPAGSMSLLLSDSAGGSSPKETLVINQFCPSWQWTNVILKLANQANDTAIISAAISANSSLLHARIWIDNLQGVLFNGGCNVSLMPVAEGKIYNPYFSPAVNDKGGAIFNDPVIGQAWSLTASNMNQGWFFCSGTPVPTPYTTTIPAPPGTGATFLWWNNNIGQNTYPYMLYAEVGGFTLQVQGLGSVWTPWTITEAQILSGNPRGSLITLTFSGQYNVNGVTAASNASQSFYWTGGDITFATYFQYFTNFGVYWGVANVALTAPSSLATWYKVVYPADGTITTQVLNHGFKPSTMGTLTANVEIAPGSSIDFYARSNSVNSGWSSIAWTLLGTATSSSPFSADLSVITTNQYLEVEAVLHVSSDRCSSPILRSIYVGTQYLSIQHNIGVQPTKWGQFISSDNANGKTITYGLATATTQGGLNIDPSSFTPIVSNTAISAPVQNTWVQVLVTLDTDNYLSLPTVDSFQLNWSSGASTTLPTTLMTSIVWDRNYYLFGQTAGDAYNNTGFCLDKNWTWQKMSGFPCGSCFMFNESPYFGGSFSGRLFSLFTGKNADFSDWILPIESYWNTYRTGLEEKGMDKWYTELVMFYEPVPAGSVDVYYDLNNTGSWTFWGTIDLTNNKGEARLLPDGFLKGRDLRIRLYNNGLSESLVIYKMWIFHEIYERIY